MVSCRRCRRRKKRCDTIRPACTSCVTSNNECIYDHATRTQIINYTRPLTIHAASTQSNPLEEKIGTNEKDEGDVPDLALKDEAPNDLQRWESIDHKKISQALGYSRTSDLGESESWRHLYATSGRITMLDHWARSYFPAKGEISTAYQYMTLQITGTVAGTVAGDFGCLVQLGQSDATYGWRKAAVALYPRVLQTLRSTLRNLDPGTLIAIVHCVQVNEQFNLVADDHRSSWHYHTKGVKAAIETQLEGSVAKRTLEPGAQHALICNFRQFSLWLGLRFGESTSNYARLWDNDVLLAESCGANVPLDNVAALVPEVIQKCRKMCNREERITIDKLIDLMRQISASETSLNGWKNEEIRASLDALNRRGSQTSNEGNIAMLDAYSSTDPALADMCYWGCLVALQKARLDLNTDIPKAESLFKLASLTEKRMIASGNLAAENMLACIQFLSHPKNGYMGLISSMAPLNLALDWYTRIGDKEGIGVCLDLQTKAKLRGMCISLS